ncbi:hypothetical protein CHLRE_12g490451v5 [Chlamydomonas reinhardtii]|uniref:Uncharacterized protein n=1 Tax=Chlamydomonas reinhardtii TaxID=3055 RepID=A0A2K3D254_CHLRE|nr:uncharacterized protein CHLRE_12g490451v5 [Chlamydomonas reinhardtii]PNW74611.1 hypothetical protein CHLRE_12g490451v5 [Chlamydomonas reinhardtii]
MLLRQRGASPVGCEDGEQAEGGEGEPNLKRRLMSAVSPPAPAVAGEAGEAAGAGGGSGGSAKGEGDPAQQEAGGQGVAASGGTAAAAAADAKEGKEQASSKETAPAAAAAGAGKDGSGTAGGKEKEAASGGNEGVLTVLTRSASASSPCGAVAAASPRTTSGAAPRGSAGAGSPRQPAAWTDDGKLKSIGGVLLEWARYMPLVTATRKGAEVAPAESVLALARRAARGELMGGLAGGHTRWQPGTTRVSCLCTTSPGRAVPRCGGGLEVPAAARSPLHGSADAKPYGMKVSPDGEWMATCGGSNNVSIHSTRTRGGWSPLFH